MPAVTEHVGLQKVKRILRESGGRCIRVETIGLAPHLQDREPKFQQRMEWWSLGGRVFLIQTMAEGFEVYVSNDKLAISEVLDDIEETSGVTLDREDS